jgi:hypothetical protein
MKESINVNVSKIFSSFIDEERCVMHRNTTDMLINHINLSNEDLDRLILQGEHIVKARDAQAFRFKDCSN